MRPIKRPLKGEYPEYADMYMGLVPNGESLLDHLWENFIQCRELIFSLPPEKLFFRYAEGKWTIPEILVHIVDDERIYAYRALRFARNDKTELPGFEQDDFVKFSGANERSLDNIFSEYEAVRKSTLALFEGLPEEAFLRWGIANDNRATVRALAYHIAGHELHHLRIIKEKYI